MRAAVPPPPEQIVENFGATKCASSRSQQSLLGFIVAVAEECFVELDVPCGLTNHCNSRSGVSFRRWAAPSQPCRSSASAAVPTDPPGDFAVVVLLTTLTLLEFVLPDRAAVLQNGNDVGLRTNFAATDCESFSANRRRCYALLCPARNSSGCNFVFVDRSSAGRSTLFLEIRNEKLAAYHRAAFLLFAALVQHARWHGGLRGREGEPPW